MTNLEILIILLATIVILMSIQPTSNPLASKSNITTKFLGISIDQEIYNTIGEKSMRFSTFIFIIMLSVLIVNQISMVPYIFTLTAHIGITLGISI